MRSENKEFNQGRSVLAIDNTAPDLSSRSEYINLEVNGITSIVHNEHNEINRTGTIPVHVDLNENSDGTE